MEILRSITDLVFGIMGGGVFGIIKSTEYVLRRYKLIFFNFYLLAQYKPDSKPWDLIIIWEDWQYRR